MSSSIVDGTGTGNKVKVCDHNRLYVRSVSQSLASWRAQQGEAYALSSGFIDLTTTEGLMVWLISTSNYLLLDRMNIGWNGGNSSHDRKAEIRLKIGENAPSANNDEAVFGNLKTDSPTELTGGSAYKWDGTGTGMTPGANGNDCAHMIVSPGDTQWDIAGKLILAPNHSFSVYAKGEEAGRFTFLLCLSMLTVKDMQEDN